jgi:hypothetical protein
MRRFINLLRRFFEQPPQVSVSELVSDEINRLRAEYEAHKVASRQAIESLQSELALANARAEWFLGLIHSEANVTEDIRGDRDVKDTLLALVLLQVGPEIVLDSERNLNPDWEVRTWVNAQGHQVVGLINPAGVEMVRRA